MTDQIYLYPKSSCPTQNCLNEYKEPKGFKSSLSVNGCKIPDFFTCYDRLEYGTKIEPKNENSSYLLNPNVYNSKLSPDFDKVSRGMCGNPCKKEDTYTSLDPRLYSSTRPGYQQLDRPPINGDVRWKDIYDKKYDSYKTNYIPYENINDGQIAYYIDKSIANAFYYPVYSEKAKETMVLYKDPMGSMKPEHNREPIMNVYNHTTDKAECYPYGLSFIQDTQSFREDIIALQQRKNNQEKWSARWAST
jgi:hypothetical protein